jgi:hypothetical protein
MHPVFPVQYLPVFVGQRQSHAMAKMVELQRRIARAALGADSCRVWPRWPSRTSTPPQLRHGSSVGAAISRIRPRSGLQSRQAPWSSSMRRVPLLPTHTYCVGMSSRVSRGFSQSPCNPGSTGIP